MPSAPDTATSGDPIDAPALTHPFSPPTGEQHDVPWRDFQQITRLVAMIGVAAGIFYLWFLLDRSHENVPALWILTVLAETVVIVHTLGIWLTLLSYRPDIPEPEDVAVMRRDLLTGERMTPTVDVLICHATEPLHLVIPTIVAADAMELPHNTWVLDDGRDDDLRTACERIGVGYLRRESNAHAKAGNVNSAIARTHGQFVVILDCDHVPRPDLLLNTLPFLLANPAVAMVQTPQTYDTEGRGMVAEGAALSQELFYEAIMPAKNQSNAAFCVGTNVVFRRAALESLTTRDLTTREERRARRQGKAKKTKRGNAVSEDGAVDGTPEVDAEPRQALTELGKVFPRGGIWIGSNSEDIWTSLELHRRGWRSVFVPKVLTQGLTPSTIGAFLKQQFRWASGGWEIMLWARVLRDHRLTLTQKLQYMLVPSHYALSFAMAIFMFLSPVYLLLDRSPIRAPFWDWALHFVPFYVLTIAVTFVQAGKFRPSAIVVSLTAAPAHIKAFFATLLRRRATWHVTNTGGGTIQIGVLLPYILLGALDVLCLVVAMRVDDQNATSPAIAMFWISLQLLMVVYLVVASERAERLTARRERDEPDSEECLALLDSYLATSKQEVTP